MSDNLKRLREPAALAAAAFAGLSLLSALIDLLLSGSASFTDLAAEDVGRFAGFEVAAAIAGAVYLANDAGPAFARSRLVTQVAFFAGAAAFLFGVVTTLALLGADGVTGSAKFGAFLGGVAGDVLVLVATWYARLAMQATAPVQAGPAKVEAAWSGGRAGPTVGGFPAAAQSQPGPPPGGFGWARQGGQGAAAGDDHTQLLPPVPPQGQPGPGQFPGGQYPGGQYPGGQYPAGAAEQTRQVPLVPPSMQEFAPQPQSWAPTGQSGQGGPHQGQLPNQQLPGQQMPGQVGQQLPGQPPMQSRSERGNPFTIGDWRE